MNASDLSSFAYVSEEYLPEGGARAVILDFPGLGGMAMRSSLDIPDVKTAHKGALFVYPYVNPWNWMNDRTVKFADRILDIVIKKYKTGKKCPLAVRGGSMGGYSALAYSMFTKHKLSAVIASCPVTDLFFHRTERPDLPRTIHDAMDSYDDISAALKSRSPNYHPEKLQDCAYFIMHGILDKAVGKAAHSDKLVRLMRKKGMDITYIEDERMAHCSPVSYQTLDALEKFMGRIIK
jgi:pimeloyl-ACP methyl ester carboxylesterase